MDPSFLLGALLIGVGLALAALAYSLISERASSEKETAEDTSTDSSQETAPEAATLSEAPETAAADEAEEPVSQEDALPSPEGEPEAVEPELAAGVESPELEAVEHTGSEELKEAPKPEPPKDRPTFPVATLMRDEVSGALVIRVGEVIYRSKEELQSSKDWGRVRFAADDLAKWMAGEPTEVDARPPTAPRTSGGKTERSKESDAPRNMVVEIDEILQELLVASSHAERAVRLMEGPGGTARVLIGIDSYSIEEVPDSEIKELIQQAVATWEATR